MFHIPCVTTRQGPECKSKTSLVDFCTTWFEAATAELAISCYFFFTKMVLKGMIKEPFEESGSVIWVVKTRVEASEYTHTQLRSVPLHKADLYIKSISALSIHHKVNLWVISSDKWTRALVSLYLIKVDAVRAFQMHRSLARGHHQEHVWVEVRTVKVFFTCDFMKEYHASI